MKKHGSTILNFDVALIILPSHRKYFNRLYRAALIPPTALLFSLVVTSRVADSMGNGWIAGNRNKELCNAEG
jgi:hypothetical protein